MLARAESAQDWAQIRAICCETGAAAPDQARWPFFGEFWVGAYERFLPEWTYLLRAPDGSIAGYLTGCPETSRLEVQRKFKQWPLLWAGIASRKFAWNADTRQFVRRRLGLEKGPEQRFSAETEQALHKTYPAHLHINLKPEFQGLREGDRLLEMFFKDLQSARVSGVHVRCGQGPLGFYLRTGFQVLEQIEVRPGVLVFTLGKRIRS